MWTSSFRRLSLPTFACRAVPRHAFGRAPDKLASSRSARGPVAGVCACHFSGHRGFHATSAVQKEDLYEMLGINKNASNAEIKKAYYKQAKKYHPDTNKGDPAAAKKFARITEAYETLSDSEKRQAYDTYGHEGLGDGSGRGGMHGFGGAQGFGGADASPEDIFRIFEQAFRMGGANMRYQGSQRGRDVRVEQTISLMEAAAGCEKEVVWKDSSGVRRVKVLGPTAPSMLSCRLASIPTLFTTISLVSL